MDNDAKYKMMTEQLRMTNSDDEVGNYIRWIIKSNIAKEYWNGYTEWIDPLKSKPEPNRKILFKIKNNDKRLGSFLPKDQWDRPNKFCDGSFHSIDDVIGWMYAPD